MEFRIEKDSLGEVKVPKDALYAAQTKRAVDNFKISGLKMPKAFIKSLINIKKTAAIVNAKLALLDKNIANAIVYACDEMLSNYDQTQFPVDVFQTGSGTSTNMNVNEVLANLASKKLGTPVSANDHVNMSQSSNDCIPSAIHISATLETEHKLQPALKDLVSALNERKQEFKELTKTGRTHLMDAMPITLGQEISAWEEQIKKNITRIESSILRTKKIAQGGTAVGTGINAHANFASEFAAELSKNLKINFSPADNFFESLSSQDSIVELSGQLKTLAVSMIKIANDLRLMNSGPLAGIGDIELKALQPGSSIMPGKVNPVIPEAVIMVGAQVMGNDATIAFAGAFGNFQLNVMLPVIAYNILQSVEILTNAAEALNHLAIKEFKANKENLEKALSLNPILVTALNPILGYQKAAEIAKTAYKEKKPIIDVALEKTDISRKDLEKILSPFALTKGGIRKK